MSTRMQRVKTIKPSTESEDLCFTCGAQIPPAMPDGEYEVAFKRFERARMWSAEKVFLWFEIITPGEWLGTELYMICAVPRGGKFGPSHKLWLMWTLAAGSRPARGDRMSMQVFRDKYFLAKIRTVTTTANGGQRKAHQQYSVIDVLLEVTAGGTKK